VSAPFVDDRLPENAGVLAYLSSRNERGHRLVLPPSSVDDPYLSLGAHPDVVERVWEQLAPAATWRAVVRGRPATVDPEAGTVLALAFGTSYWLRLTARDLELALTSGASQSHLFGRDGPRLDAAAMFGPTWIHGSWDGREPEWLLATSVGDRGGDCT
jgi:hypothetical protein